MNLKKSFKIALENSGKSQNQVCRDANVTAATYIRMRETNQGSLISLNKIALAMGTNAADLIRLGLEN